MKIQGNKDGLLYLGLNQDHSCFACGDETGIRIFNCDPIKQLQHQTFSNGIGHVEMLFRLAQLHTTSCLLAFPSVDQGQVCLVNISEDSQSQMRMIPAHTNSLAILDLNMQGTMLATASDKGTLIRIFDTQTCLLLYELRRGTNRANIHSIAFNRLSSLLCVTSDSKTLHIFSLDGKSTSRSVTKYTMSSSLPALCCFGAEEMTVVLVSSSGFYYKIRWNEKGETFKEEQFKFLLMTDD